MSRAVLISIRPKWCELIASGKKSIEVRKTRPKIETPFKCYMYMSAYHWAFSLLRQYGMDDLADRLMHETGKVIGEFLCKLIDTYTLHTTPNFYTGYYKISPNGGLLYAVGGDEQTQIPEDELLAYGKGQNIYGWHISDLVIYDKPMKLTDFIRPSGGCCNEGKCTGCKYLDKGNGYNVEDDCLADFDTDSYSIVTRPPQSWGYVEELT